MTYPSAPTFRSGERDSAWFIIYDSSGADRLVLTTGREVALRAQRALLEYLRETNPSAADDFRIDGAVGPMTLRALYDYLYAHGLNDTLGVAIQPVISRAPSLLPPALLTALISVGWRVPLNRISIPGLTSNDGLPYNRRAPSPRGPGADVEAIRAFMASGGNSGVFTIVRDGRYAQTSRAPIAAAGQIAVATVHNAERNEDSLAPVLPNDPEPGPGMGTLAIVGTVAFVGLAGGLILWLTSSTPVGAAAGPARRR